MKDLFSCREAPMESLNKTDILGITWNGALLFSLHCLFPRTCHLGSRMKENEQNNALIKICTNIRLLVTNKSLTKRDFIFFFSLSTFLSTPEIYCFSIKK